MCHAAHMASSPSSGAPLAATDRAPLIALWSARIGWLGFPFGAATLIEPLPDGRFRLGVEIIAWSIWTIGCAALLIPRPQGLAAIRVLVATTGWLVVGYLQSGHALPIAGICTAALGALLLLNRPLADALVDGKSYGSEQRFALRLPPAITWVGYPLAGAGWASLIMGTLSMWSGSSAHGRNIALILGGLLLAAATFRSARVMCERFLVFVPAGCVVADPFQLLDPVLMPGTHLRSVGPTPDTVPAGSLDLRCGASLGALEFCFTEPGRVAAKERFGGVQEVTSLLITPARTVAYMNSARTRRILSAKA